MSMEVEVSLRIPNMKVRALDENGYPIDNSSVRFKKRLVVPSIPKPGDPLQLSTSSGSTFESKVVRAEWDEGKSMFVLACQYGNRSITADEYGALVNDPDWEMKPLI
jgi:hypothetical protein